MNWTSFGRALAAAAPLTTFLAAEVIDGECFPIYGASADRRIAIASTFKLYVLGELARQVTTGGAAWEERLSIDNCLKSKPPGAMRYEPAGTQHTLQYFAERMIAESDNTATDHLIARLGRENVESVQAVMGHELPELNMPLLMTRELFTFKIAVAPLGLEDYLAANIDRRRRILEKDISPVRLTPEGWGTWNGPKWIDSIEWFASAREVCRALAYLQTLSEQPGLESVAEVLAVNRGPGAFDPVEWPYVGFKSGSEAGVYCLCWLLQRTDGRRFVAAAGFNDPDAYVDRAACRQLLETLGVLLSTTTIGENHSRLTMGEFLDYGWLTASAGIVFPASGDVPAVSDERFRRQCTSRNCARV